MDDLFDEKNIILEADFDGKGMQNDESQNPFLAKAKEAVCLIKYKGKSGTGFFCDVPGIKGDVPLTFLITNCHVYPQNSEITEKCIDIIINGNPKTIKLEGRGKWTNSKMDFTCIEIKKEEVNINTSFSLDDNILKSNYSNKDYLNKSVTVYGLNKHDNFELNYSYGCVEKLDKWLFTHTCNTEKGCSGGCITVKDTNLVIGIHMGEYGNKIANIGIFINDAIKDIKEQVNHYLYNLL